MDIRVYFSIFANTAVVPNEQQWQTLLSRAKNKPLSSSILEAARDRGAEKYISARKRNQGTDALRWTIVGFEVDNSEISDIIDVLNAEALLRGLSGVSPVAERFIRVLEQELQESALDLGYAGQASLLTIEWYTYGSRDIAIEEAQQYLSDNSDIWRVT